MKKLMIAAIAALLTVGTVSAQANKFKAAASKTTKTEVKKQSTKATQVTKENTQTATQVKKEKAVAQPKAKAATKTTKAKVAAKPVNRTVFNGTWANSYDDGIGGTVTDYLDLTFDEATGTARGEYKDENGNGRKVSGKLVGNNLVMTYDEDGDEFATINIINENTLKLQGFTGTFKRVKDMNSAPKVDIATPVSEAPVDPAFEEVKKHLEEKNKQAE